MFLGTSSIYGSPFFFGGARLRERRGRLADRS